MKLVGSIVGVLKSRSSRTRNPPAAIVVPQRAVLEGPSGKFVYVVNAESKAEPRPVEVGTWVSDGWVINAGLKPGERVIVDGVLKIAPGAPVNVTEAAPKTNGKPAEDKPAEKPAAKPAVKS